MQKIIRRILLGTAGAAVESAASASAQQRSGGRCGRRHGAASRGAGDRARGETSWETAEDFDDGIIIG